MGKDNKRKRDQNVEDETEQPSRKTQMVQSRKENDVDFKPEARTGERRQLKSERKKKTNLSRSKHDTRTKEKEKEKVISGGVSTNTIPDAITNGQDYVPLTESTSPDKTDSGGEPRGAKKEQKKRAAQEVAGNRKKKTAKEPGSGSDARFICFVGNLPYSVTTEQIAAHFSKLQPKAVRLSTDKNTGKCKGFAFLEFDNYDKMKTCLKLYHHSIFDPDSTEPGDTIGSATKDASKSKGRKINVELTAGGGGKSAGRKDKIQAKNQKLNDERARDWEKKQQEEANKSQGRRGGKERQPASGANAETADQITDTSRGDIHPSRLGRVRG